MDAPQMWFCSINSTSAASRVTLSLTKFHWAVSKLPSTLVNTGPLWNNHTAVANPYAELQNIVL